MTHFFLDLDNTVTESRGKISPEMFDTLSKIESVIIVSGADEKQIRSQIGDLKCEILAQNGNSNSIWKRELNEKEREEIMRHINSFAQIGEDQLEDRGAQISYSFVGHHAPIEDKKAFDPKGEYRRKVLKNYPLENDLIEVKIAGTTCFDYLPKGLHKGYNVAKFAKYMGWKKADCLYIGDALFPGGNDETVIGVIPTFPVENHLETLDFLKNT